MELSGNQHPLEDKEQTSSCKSHRLNVVSDNKEEKDKTLMNIDEYLDYQNDPNKSMLIDQLGHDMSINCLIRCSRVDYEAIALVNKNFRSLISSGELYKLRRKAGIVEHWVYYSCDLLEWEAFDPVRGRFMSLPRMTSTECFMCSNKESLAVGTELLVFGKDILSQVIYRYNILTNEWTSDIQRNAARFLFASSSVRGIAILAGGCDPRGNIMKSAELYNSDKGTWDILPSMNKARKMCSGVFMDEKFYVFGGIGEGDTKQLKCAEEFDLETKTWRLIPNMLPTRDPESKIMEAPPLMAVVNNVLYAADYAEMVVKRFNKGNNTWVTIGGFPDTVKSMNGWGLAFRACGNMLIMIGGSKHDGRGRGVEVHSCVPGQGALRWDLLARRLCGSFVYNSTVMGC